MAAPLDPDVVLTWLRRKVPSVAHAGASGVELRKFNHGQSNPTYLLTLQPTKKQVVLRKQPPGRLLRGAHAVDREFRVMEALGRLDFPVPRMLAMENDRGVLDGAFYVMEFVRGQIHVDPSLPELLPSERRSAYLALASTLADLHSVDVQSAGLSDFGKAERYAERQVATWKRQYAADWGNDPLPEMVALTAWLEANVKKASASHALNAKPAIAHGDFRLDNAVLARDGSGAVSVVAVLDWELSTLGDPLADLAYLCLTLYHAPPAAAPTPGKRIAPPPGAPGEQELVEHYCSRRGIAPPPPDVFECYLALGCYRMAAILAGVQARAQRGNASATNAAEVGAAAKGFAAYALSLVGAAAPVAKTTPQPWYQSKRSAEYAARLAAFMDAHVSPAEAPLLAHEAQAVGDDRWRIHPLVEELKSKAKSAGLWNLFLPADTRDLIAPAIRRDVDCGPGLSNLEYAPLSEMMGRSFIAPECFNCSAPDTGNMETLARCGTHDQQETWLRPLLEGRIRSCFAMTEPEVASSDATNVRASISAHNAAEVELNGRKWWTTGAPDPRCRLCIFLGLDSRAVDAGAPRHMRHSMVLVPLPHPGVRQVRALTVFGYDDAPHGHAELEFDRVRVPASNVMLGQGRGFEIAQRRLGPGRLHHCMRVVGLGERALELAAERASQRRAFGKTLAMLSTDKLAEGRLALRQARLVVLDAAAELDRSGNKAARVALAAAKVAAPRAALLAVDHAMQMSGGAGVSQDLLFARMYAGVRTLRFADGPDEVHLRTIGQDALRMSKL